MEERKDALDAQQTYDFGAGFIVGDHNYGRLDRMSNEEIAALGGHVEQLARQVATLQEGLAIARRQRLERYAEEIKSKYDC